MAVSVCLPEYLCVTNDQFRVLEEISGNRSPSSSKPEAARPMIFWPLHYRRLRPSCVPAGRICSSEDLAMPLLQCASTRGKRHAANALAHLEEAPRRLVLALANEPVEISAPLLLRSPLLRPSDLVDIIAGNGIAHARAIARRQSDDVLLRGVLRSFADAAIDRTLALQENLANIDAEPLEKPEIPDLSVASGPLMRKTIPSGWCVRCNSLFYCGRAAGM